MFGNSMFLRPTAKPAPKKIMNKPSRFAFIRNFTNRIYHDPYRWGLVKCVAFFAASVFVAQTLCELDILPADPPSQTPQAAY